MYRTAYGHRPDMDSRQAFENGLFDEVGVLKKEADTDDTEVSRQLQRIDLRQREILLSTFSEIEKQGVKNGVVMFVRLLSENPQYKKIWPQFRAIPDSALLNADALKRHATVYMCGLGHIIHAMEDEAKLALYISQIAKSHVKWSIQRAHVENMLVPFLEVVRSCLGTVDAETQHAWSTLFDVITNLIEYYRHK